MRFPSSCDSYRCDVCGPRKAFKAAAIASWALRHAARPRFLTLTLAPDDWQERRWAVNGLRRKLMNDGYRCEWAWATERGSRTGMTHVHLLQHGSYIPQAALQDAWGSIVDIRAVKSDGLGKYVTKEALRVAGYVMKGARAELQGYETFLELNGGRSMHWSRGYLHGLTKREASTALGDELRGERERQAWHLEIDESLRLSA